MQQVIGTFETAVSNTRPALMAPPGAVMSDYMGPIKSCPGRSQIGAAGQTRRRTPTPLQHMLRHATHFAGPATTGGRCGAGRHPRRRPGARAALSTRDQVGLSPGPLPLSTTRNTDSRVGQPGGKAHPRPGPPPAPPPRRAPPTSPSAVRRARRRRLPARRRPGGEGGRSGWAGRASEAGARRGARRSVQSWLRGTKAPAAGARRGVLPPRSVHGCVHRAAPGFFLAFSLRPSRGEREMI